MKQDIHPQEQDPYIKTFLCLEDNYGVLWHDPITKKTIAIDVPDAEKILMHLEKNQWSLEGVLITHHHYDHIEGLKRLKQETKALIYAPKKSKSFIPDADFFVQDQETIAFGSYEISVIETPGHTLDSVCFYNAQKGILFTGDTLFSLGCGRLMEGTAEQLFKSLQKLLLLPDNTKIYCGHEYSYSNAAFTCTIESDNEALQAYFSALKSAGFSKNTIAHSLLPSNLAKEKALNPFLRFNSSSIRKTLNQQEASDLEVFSLLRKKKDAFRL